MPPNCTECQRLKEVINKKDSKVEELKEKVKKCNSKIKELDERKVKRKEIEDLKREKDNFEEEINQLRAEIDELKKELERKDVRMDSLENGMNEMQESHQEEMEEMKNSFCKLEERNAKKIQELKERQNEEIEKMEHYRTSFDMNEAEIQKLREKNKKLMNSNNANDKKLIVGQICLELQNNLYRYIMPERCCAKDQYYKIKDIEKEIDDEDLLNDEERQEAKKRLQEVKKKINWGELKKLIRTMKLLQDSRNEVAHPSVDEKGAMDAAQELHVQGKLRGTTSLKRVEQIIRIWSVSKLL